MRIEGVRGDITEQHVDAIVNAANSGLLGGGGVDGAIHGAAGPSLLAECKRVRRDEHPDGLPTGEAVATDAGELPCRFVIHTVGPQHHEHSDGGVDLLASCHRRSLEIADGLGVTTIAFPAISCGVYGWSVDDAAPVAVAAVREFAAAQPDSSIELVRFVLSNADALAAFEAACSALE